MMRRDKKKTPQDDVERAFPSLSPSTMRQGSDLGSIERDLRSRVLEESARTLEAALNDEILRHPTPMVCPRFWGTLKEKGIRPKEILTLFGAITVRRRYGYCPMQEGNFPDDRRLGVDGSGLSPEVKRLSSVLRRDGLCPGSDLLWEAAGSVCGPCRGGLGGRDCKEQDGGGHPRSSSGALRTDRRHRHGRDGDSNAVARDRGRRGKQADAPPRGGKRRCATSGRPTT